MNDVKVTKGFQRSLDFVTEYYFVWLKGLLLVGIPLAVLGWFLFRWFRVGLTGPF